MEKCPLIRMESMFHEIAESYLSLHILCWSYSKKLYSDLLETPHRQNFGSRDDSLCDPDHIQSHSVFPPERPELPFASCDVPLFRNFNASTPAKSLSSPNIRYACLEEFFLLILLGGGCFKSILKLLLTFFSL